MKSSHFPFYNTHTQTYTFFYPPHFEHAQDDVLKSVHKPSENAQMEQVVLEQAGW